MGITRPLILIWIGAPAVKNMSEACFSAISLNSGVTNMVAPPGRGGPLYRLSIRLFWHFPAPVQRASGARMSVAAQQLVDAGLGAGLGVHLLDDDRAIEAAAAVAVGQAAGHDDRAGGHASVKYFTGLPVVDAGALPDEH